MTQGATLIEKGMLPEGILRFGIRSLLRIRLFSEWLQGDERKGYDESDIALRTHDANEQHYEVPSSFFELVLGKHLKYSCCYFPQGITELSDAEAASLDQIIERAEIEDGMRILELGCGWGSLSLALAARFPDAEITSVSNSSSQRQFIEAQAKARGIQNLTILTADMNFFEAKESYYDRVVSIEMFEHMRNHKALLEKISRWLLPQGKLFVHVFCHKRYTYLFSSQGKLNWMGRHFFSGGMMPSSSYLSSLKTPLKVLNTWELSGTHYQKTAECWVDSMKANREEVLASLRNIYGAGNEERWFERWRIFFLACAELFGFRGGKEWFVTHYLFQRPKA